MSEFWVSKKKYFCKYCDIYIADDAPSRQQHENGLRHKGNVERFIRGIYKSGEKQKKDLEEEKREMKRVEQAAAAAFAADVGAGHARAPLPVASTSAAPKNPAEKPSNPYANYSTAQSLGYTDPDAERIAAEAEIRRSQGVAGEWQILTPLQPPSTTNEEETEDNVDSPTGEAGVKREAEAPPDEEDTRAFKLRKKTLSRGLGEMYDPGLIPIKVKKKEVIPPIPESTLTTTASTAPPKWASTQWKRPGDNAQKQNEGNGTITTHGIKTEGGSSTTTNDSGPSKWAKPQWSQPLPDLKQEELKSIFGDVEEKSASDKPNDSAVRTEPDVKQEPQVATLDEASQPSVLFKKRKAPSGSGRGRREI